MGWQMPSLYRLYVRKGAMIPLTMECKLHFRYTHFSTAPLKKMVDALQPIDSKHDINIVHQPRDSEVVMLAGVICAPHTTPRKRIFTPFSSSRNVYWKTHIIFTEI